MGFLKPDVPDAPPAPDINEMLEAQGRLNRPNVVGPYGSSTWTQDPEGRYTQTNELSPQLRPLYDASIDYQMRGPGTFNYGTNPGAQMYERLGMPPPSSTGGGVSYGNPVPPPMRQPLPDQGNQQPNPFGQEPPGGGQANPFGQPPPYVPQGGGGVRPQGQLPPQMVDFLRMQRP